MTPVLSVAQMREIDSTAIAKDAAKGYGFMERAGTALCNEALKLVTDPSDGRVAVLCGKGNNGGDGFVAARLLCEKGYSVTCFSVEQPENLRGEALIAFKNCAAKLRDITVLESGAGFCPQEYVLIIDALLGTGLCGPARGIYAELISAVNSSGVMALAVDTPSGLDNDTGVPFSPCINATATVTMGFPKIGQYFYPGRSSVGRLAVADLGYPQDIVELIQPRTFTPSTGFIADLLPPRREAGSKYDHGQTLLVGGSPGMAGSITLAAEAAMRCGCGMVRCAVPESLISILSLKLTEPVLHALPQTSRGTAHVSAFDKIMELAQQAQSLCIGPGLSHEPPTSRLVCEIIGHCATPTLLDADGLNAFRGRTDLLERHAGKLVLTPHAGEWERLFGPPETTPQRRIEQVREAAQRIRSTIVLKGSPTLVGQPDGVCHIMPCGNSALAKAGSGDILSGTIASFMAQGVPCEKAALLGVWIHGEAGCRAAQSLTEYGVTGRDIIASIPAVIRELVQTSRSVLKTGTTV